VKHGFVASLNRPGGNVTGVTFIGGELAGKRLDLLQKLIPHATTVAFLSGDSSFATYQEQTTEMVAAGRALNLEVIVVECRSDRDFDAASLQDRSAVRWADKLDVPVLLMHGTADWRVYAVEALHLAQELQRANKTYQLMMFANDSHGLPAHRSDVNHATIAWFKSFAR
jgi:pimeloyl-ACP methyl ester carboxylesterase